MAVEDLTGTKYLNSLVRTNPDGNVDPMAVVDEQLQGMKNVILNTFPNLNGAVNSTPAELNLLSGKTSIATLGGNTFTSNQFIQGTSPSLTLTNLGAAGSLNGILNFQQGATAFAQINGDYSSNLLSIRKLDAVGTGTAAQMTLNEAGVVDVPIGTLQQGGSPVITHGQRRLKRKIATEIVVSSITLQNDNELFFVLEANKQYNFELSVRAYSTSSTPDLKFTYSVPSGAGAVATYDYNALEFAPGTPVSKALNAGTAAVVRIQGLVNMGATAGNLQFQWSQLISDPTATQVLADSWISVDEIV